MSPLPFSVFPTWGFDYLILLERWIPAFRNPNIYSFALVGWEYHGPTETHNFHAGIWSLIKKTSPKYI